MKVLFINPPNIRSATSTPENDFSIKEFIVPKHLSKIKWSEKIFKSLDYLFGIGSGVRYGVRAGSRWPFTMDQPVSNYAPYPFFMGYAASNLREHGFEVNILDAVAEDEYDYQKFLKQIKLEEPDLVVIECSTPTIDIDVWFANKVAEFSKVALAGPHLNENTVGEIRSDNPNISFYLLGEYILSSLKMAQSQISGVYNSEVLKDLDTFPFPFRDFKSITKYFDPSMPTPKPQLAMYGSKGCPFKCTFCSWPQTMYFGNVALRSPDKIAEEIRDAIEKHGFRSIFFDDDTFNLGTKRISKLCDYLKEIGLPWTMMGRLDISPDWLYDKMVESGCVGMRFGVETFNIDVLKNIEKGIERRDFKKTLEYICLTYPEVMIHITMMSDMPGQTAEDTEIDMKIIKEMGFSNDNIFRTYQLSKCAPFPGTKLYEQMETKLDEATLKTYTLYDGGQDTIMKNL
tara:strand:+ start:387 stop:1757 length:1371 start_codon:yes stop_codon:yes gene_type:complete